MDKGMTLNELMITLIIVSVIGLLVISMYLPIFSITQLGEKGF